MSVTIRDMMTNHDLFGNQFSGDSWAAWLALLSGLYGLPLNSKEKLTFESITGRSGSPQQACEELWLVIGRRGGKSQMAALLAVMEACFNNHQSKLSPGEVATVMVLAADRKQARTVMRYIAGLMESNPMLQRLIIKQNRESIELSNRCCIEVGTASFRSVRGYTIACVIADELAFWRSDESANPDLEILNALRPALTTLNGKLIALSSPYRKKGALWQTYQRYYGKPGNILVAQAPSRIMNPTLSQRAIDEALERDQAVASAEYLAQFRSDLETFIQQEVIERAVRPQPLELAYDHSHKYYAFTDPTGGGADEFTLAIGHIEDKLTVVDLLRARRGTPADIVAEYAETLKAYGLQVVTGDKYAGSWPGDEFKRHGIEYKPSEKPKSGLYLDLLPALNSGRVQIPPDDRLINQLSKLERRTARGGRDSIDHAPGGHDDRANAIAGLVSTRVQSNYNLSLMILGHDIDQKPNPRRSLGTIAAVKAAGIPL
ncbi:MAG: hypothetical protein L3J22_05625 [Xanthomonadales bacterium]|nr:hypothetical protein [Xanthomonadales bacterium]